MHGDHKSVHACVCVFVRIFVWVVCMYVYVCVNDIKHTHVNKLVIKNNKVLGKWLCYC